jgi:hypothetical protein
MPGLIAEVRLNRKQIHDARAVRDAAWPIAMSVTSGRVHRQACIRFADKLLRGQRGLAALVGIRGGIWRTRF